MYNAPPPPANPQNIQGVIPQTTQHTNPNNPDIQSNEQHQIFSKAPPFLAGPKHPFGTLSVKIVRCKNLKAGQGFFGKADPYVKLNIGEKEFITEPHMDGGKNPVSPSKLIFLLQLIQH